MANLKLHPDDVDRLVGLPAVEILKASQSFGYPPDYATPPWPDTMVQSQFAPTIDGVELLEHPSKSAAAGRVAPGVNVVFGSNRDEGTMFVSNNNYTKRGGVYSGASLPLTIDEAQFVDYAFGSWGTIVGRMMSEENVYPLKCRCVLTYLKYIQRPR